MKHIRTLMDEVAQHIEIDEGRMKDIFTMDQEGQSVKEIAKRLKLPLGTVKKILGEETDLQEFSDSQLDVLARQYAGLKGRTISIDQANKLRQIFNRIPDRSLDALRRKKIPFLSGLALSRMVQKGMPVREEKECPPGQYYCKVSGTCKPNSMKQEAFAVQVTKKDGGKFIHGSYKSKAEAEKFVKWYKTGDLRTTKKIEVVKEMAKDDAYAIGMAQAKKSMKDEPPLEKKTITKGHEIAKKILAKEARWQIEGQLGYRGIRNQDGFHMVINASSEQDAENKAYKELDKARDRKKIGPGGGGSLEDVDIENIERTSDKLQAPSTFRVSEFDPSEVKEGKAPFRLSYDDRYGKHAGFEDAKTLADLQNKAANLRKKGFVINKMGRKTSPVKEQRIRPKRIVEFTSQQIKQAYGIANDPRYKGGNYDGAVKAIEKLAKGLSKHPDVAKVLKRTNENAHAGARLVFETIKGLKNKADKTGMPYSILKKVYDRGMAAWRGGHRPGTTQQQWAFARVNSFVTKSSGTWGGADKDLAKLPCFEDVLAPPLSEIVSSFFKPCFFNLSTSGIDIAFSSLPLCILSTLLKNAFFSAPDI